MPLHRSPRASLSTFLAGLVAAIVLGAGLSLTAGSAPASASYGLGSGSSSSPAKSKTKYCTGIEKNKKVSATKVFEVKQRSKTTADLYMCKKSGKRYVRDRGPYKTRLGYNGTTSSKKEGDGKTPKGTFWMRAGFGTSKNPGLKQKWTKVTRDHVWVDGKASKKGKYNTMQRKSKGYKGESLYNTTAYKHAQVIGYNEARKAGKGSGIFLHVNTKSMKTAGCVSMYKTSLVTAMKWQGNHKVQMVIH